MNIDECRLPFIKESNTPKSHTLCKDGDIAFADASEDTNDVAKAVELVNCDGKKIICGLHTIHGRDRLNITYIGYKAFAFSSPKFGIQINKIAQGTKVFSISVKNFNELFIGIPSLDEQKKIVSLLSLIEERIATQNKIIAHLESLIKGLYSATSKIGWRNYLLSELMIERKELNTSLFPVYSVSVDVGLVDQIEHLGRSFAAKDTSNYNVVRLGDVVYTKSPTGSFPFGIVKQSLVNVAVAVSPLYGVYQPKSIHIGRIIQHYFASPIRTSNYLHSLIQKGAKNTINISTQHFLDKAILLPSREDEVICLSELLDSYNSKCKLEKALREHLLSQKTYLLQKMFI